jgi:hypothetical protein
MDPQGKVEQQRTTLVAKWQTLATLLSPGFLPQRKCNIDRIAALQML